MAAAAAHDAPSRWASLLHPDLIPLIGRRVLAGDLLDYVRFRAVCALWRSSTISPGGRGRGLVDSRFYPRRWVLLPEGYDICPGHSSLLGYVRSLTSPPASPCARGSRSSRTITSSTLSTASSSCYMRKTTLFASSIP
jgi:hypothetical protein